MKYLKIILPGAASLLLTTVVPNFAAVTGSGQDNRVEWKPAMELKLPEKAKDFAYSLDGKYAFVLAESNKVLVYDQKGELQGRIPVDAGVSDIAIAPLGRLLYLLDSEKNILSALAVDFILDINTAGSPFKGAADAPVAIAVFSDFE
ncbi:MAG: hypothetical protein OEL83_15010 [Desulforhopalus sp.]|nr:hypothetical protein [Desulforhopalus sp.]